MMITSSLRVAVLRDWLDGRTDPTSLGRAHRCHVEVVERVLSTAGAPDPERVRLALRNIHGDVAQPTATPPPRPIKALDRGRQSTVAATRRLAERIEVQLAALNERLKDEAERAKENERKAQIDEQIAALQAERAQLAGSSAGSKAANSQREIRDWAAANGHQLGDRGRIPAAVREAWLAAQPTNDTGADAS